MDTVTEINAWLEQGKALVTRLQAEANGEAVPGAEADTGNASSPTPETDNFSTPALAGNAPASVPTVTPVDEADVPAEVKAADQGA